MLYLILSSEVDIIDLEKGEFSYSPLLKIGYTKDIDSRFDSYELHNAGCRLLSTREGGKDLESYFHSYYSKYKYPNRGEWFYYSQEIVDNFQTLEIGDKFLSKEEYIEGLRVYLKSNIPIPQELKSKCLDGLLEELKNIESEVKFNEKFHRSFTMNLWKCEYNKEIMYINSFDFDNFLRDLPEEVNLRENLWKSITGLYYRNINHRKDTENFNQKVNDKKNETENLLLSYQSTPTESSKFILAKSYQDLVFFKDYEDDYVAVNEEKNDQGKVILKPVFNNLVMINEVRAFEIWDKSIKLLFQNTDN